MSTSTPAVKAALSADLFAPDDPATVTVNYSNASTEQVTLTVGVTTADGRTAAPITGTTILNPLTVTVTDGTGTEWPATSDDGSTAVFAGTAGPAGTLTVTASVVAADGATGYATATATVKDPARFPDDPGVGNLRLGASVEGGDPTTMEALVGPLAEYRSYVQAADTPATIADRVTRDRAAGRYPILSTKVPGGNWQGVANGSQDAWLLDRLTAIHNAGGAVLCLHHEPENDTNGTTCTSETYKAMYRHAKALADEHAPSVLLVPILMSGWFNSVTTPVAANRKILSDWVDPAAVHGIGWDGYNHYDPNNGKPWRTASEVWAEPLQHATDLAPNLPVFIAEMNTRVDPNTPGRAATWLQESYDLFTAHNVAAASVFNSGQNVNDGGHTWVLSGSTDERAVKIKALLAAPTTVRLAA